MQKGTGFGNLHEGQLFLNAKSKKNCAIQPDLVWVKSLLAAAGDGSTLADLRALKACRRVVSHVGGRTFQAKILKSVFLVFLAPLGVEGSRNNDFTTPEAHKAEKMLPRMRSYVHFTVYI